MPLTSPSHRAALRFFRGGLVAVVALLVPSQFGFISREAPVALIPLVAFMRVAVPAVGFAIGGAIGGTALHRGRQGVVASGAGLLVAGVALSLVTPALTGLTGFENRLTVLLFAAAATGGAFALGGGVLALLLDRRSAARVSGGFLAGGVVGGLISVGPAVLAAPLAGWPSDVQLFVRLGCSLVGLLGPFAVAGAVAGKMLGNDEGSNGELRTEK